MLALNNMLFITFTGITIFDCFNFFFLFQIVRKKKYGIRNISESRMQWYKKMKNQVIRTSWNVCLIYRTYDIMLKICNNVVVYFVCKYIWSMKLNMVINKNEQNEETSVSSFISNVPLCNAKQNESGYVGRNIFTWYKQINTNHLL